MTRFEELTEGRSPLLLAVLTVIAFLIAGVIVGALGFEFIAIIVAAAGLPVALAVWLTAD